MHVDFNKVKMDVPVVSLGKLVKWYGTYEQRGLDYSLVFNTLWDSLNLTHASVIGLPYVIEALWEGVEGMKPDESRNITLLDIRSLTRFIVELENTSILHDQEVLIAQWDDVHAK